MEDKRKCELGAKTGQVISEVRMQMQTMKGKGGISNGN